MRGDIDLHEAKSKRQRGVLETMIFGPTRGSSGVDFDRPCPSMGRLTLRDDDS